MILWAAVGTASPLVQVLWGKGGLEAALGGQSRGCGLSLAAG
jgi:hypothetical protein